ncbi:MULTISPECIES: hypothetical protein [unclassified Pseudomonas]|uniref:hypothetical protein n=1 Tax=unclassified Pseudomonas TaxID=196821 RepID=UPI00164776B0|nr:MULTISPECIES: hypothetical protein [unclassified Pseudomonas]MBC3270761.1 hypothetical protein [Pseudomonas sp. SWRI81]MBC3775106.1 hypothetical protein [Pseudomonas sp. SWRI99]
MKTYARISSDTVVELFTTDGNMAEMFHPDLLWVDISEVTPAPQLEWTAHFGTLGWVFAAPEGTQVEKGLKTLANKWLARISRQP